MILSKNATIALGSVVLYYCSLHKFSSLLGGLVYWSLGWALPLIFLIFSYRFLIETLPKKYSVSSKAASIIAVSFVAFCIISSIVVDESIYRLHTIGGDEGCGCRYFSYGDGRLDSDEYRIATINNAKFFQYTAESFFKGFHLGGIN